MVDPEVPAARALCVAKTQNNRYVVAPDNGTLADVVRRYGIEWVKTRISPQTRLQIPYRSAIPSSFAPKSVWSTM